MLVVCRYFWPTGIHCIIKTLYYTARDRQGNWDLLWKVKPQFLRRLYLSSKISMLISSCQPPLWIDNFSFCSNYVHCTLCSLWLAGNLQIWTNPRIALLNQESWSLLQRKIANYLDLYQALTIILPSYSSEKKKSQRINCSRQQQSPGLFNTASAWTSQIRKRRKRIAKKKAYIFRSGWSYRRGGVTPLTWPYFGIGRGWWQEWKSEDNPDSQPFR